MRGGAQRPCCCLLFQARAFHRPLYVFVNSIFRPDICLLLQTGHDMTDMTTHDFGP
jgi:hypothetical protein